MNILQNHSLNKTFGDQSHGKLRMVFSLEDEPEFLIKKERLINIINNQINKKTMIVRKKFLINHPVVHLLERNLKQATIHDMIFKEQIINDFKDYSYDKFNILQKLIQFYPNNIGKNIKNPSCSSEI